MNAVMTGDDFYKSLKNGTMLVNLTVGCKNTSHYASIVSRLRTIPSVLSVSR